MPPNSDAVVCPTSTAPAERSREVMVPSYSAMRSLSTSDASVWGHPLTGSSSFTPMGTPPKAVCTSADAAADGAFSSSMKHTAFNDDFSIAASDPSSASVGESSPSRKASTSEQASPSQGCPVTHTKLATAGGTGIWRHRACEQRATESRSRPARSVRYAHFWVSRWYSTPIVSAWSPRRGEAADQPCVAPVRTSTPKRKNLHSYCRYFGGRSRAPARATRGLCDQSLG